MRWIITPHEDTDIELLGGKAAALARLAPTGLSIPGWFVISPAAMRASLGPEQRALFDSKPLRMEDFASLDQVEPDAELMQSVYAAFHRMYEHFQELRSIMSADVDRNAGAFREGAAQTESTS